MAKNPLIPKGQQNKPNFVDLPKSRGILDDYKEGKVGQFKELYSEDLECITLTINGVNIFERDNTWSGTNTFQEDVTIEVSQSQFTISNQQDADTFFYFDSSAGGIAWYGVAASGFVEMGGLDVHINENLEVKGYSYQNATFSTPVRALNTIYQNTTGHTIKVTGSCTCLFSDNNSTDLAYFNCQTGSASPPTTLEKTGGCTVSAFAVITNSAYVLNFPFDFEVPNNHYYRILSTVTGAGAVALTQWREVNK